MELIIEIVCGVCLIYLFSGIATGVLGLFIEYKTMSEKGGTQKIRKRIRRPHYLPISIIVYAKNNERTIVDCVNSLIKQNHKKYEIIIVDDGSRDGTSKTLINQYKLVAVKKPLKNTVGSGNVKEVYETIVNGVKISLLRKDGSGRGDSMNAGINASEFPLFLSVDGTMYLPGNAISIMMQPMLEDENTIASCGNIDFIGYYGENAAGEDEIMDKNLVANLYRVAYERDRLVVNGCKGRFQGQILMQENFCLFRKKLVVEVGGYERLGSGMDRELISRIAGLYTDSRNLFSVAFEDGAVGTSYEKLDYGSTTMKHKAGYVSKNKCLRACGFYLTKRDYMGSQRLMAYRLFYSSAPYLDTITAVSFVTATVMKLLTLKIFLIGWLIYGIIYGLLTGASLLVRSAVSARDLTLSSVLVSMFYGMIDNMLLRFLRNVMMLAVSVKSK